MDPKSQAQVYLPASFKFGYEPAVRGKLPDEVSTRTALKSKPITFPIDLKFELEPLVLGNEPVEDDAAMRKRLYKPLKNKVLCGQAAHARRVISPTVIPKETLKRVGDEGWDMVEDVDEADWEWIEDSKTKQKQGEGKKLHPTVS